MVGGTPPNHAVLHDGEVNDMTLGWRQGGCGKKYSQKIFSNSLDHEKSQKITKNHKSVPFWAAAIVL